MFPYGNVEATDARIYACTSKCDTINNTFVWTPTEHNLAKIIGSTRELFYDTADNGICYLGTYRCSETGQYAPEEFAAFSSSVIILVSIPL